MNIRNLSGKRLGHYTLNELLGTGGMSAVYRGYQVTLGRDVAIKLLLPDLANQGRYIERFYHESRIAASLQHTNIVPIFDYAIQNGVSYLAMRLLTGGSLMDRLRQRQTDGQNYFSLREISELLRQIGNALDFAHSDGVIHRDIKMGNIMFDDQGTAYLVDFGIAMIMDVNSGEAPSVTAGTLAYMAPELWKGETPTHSVDQYALGLVIYTLLTGHNAFEDVTQAPRTMMRKHLEEWPTPIHQMRPDVTDAISNVVYKAIAKTPEARYPTIRAFSDEFDRAVERSQRERFVASGLRALRKTSELNLDREQSVSASNADAENKTPSGNRGVRTEDKPTIRKSEDLTKISPDIAEWQAFANEPIIESGRGRISRSALSIPNRGLAKIFICYRRSETSDVTGRIFDRLVQHFGKDLIFKDVEAIPLGTNFKNYLERIVRNCAVELVVIGRNWLDTRDETGRRIDNPDDLVRIEIEAALNTDIPVIPLLVQGASMPRKELLPEALTELVYCQGTPIRHDPDFHNDVDKLILAITQLMKHP